MSLSHNVSSFADFNLHDTILKGIENAGFQQPSPIQQQAIPVILQGRDIIGQAHTGTGKTAAFGLPCLNLMKNTGSVELIVITPTRELATQVSDELFKLGQFANIRTVTISGGSSYARQIERVKSGAHIIVATPGRLLDLLNSGRIGKLTPSMVVLDEADEMLDMGFLEDIQKIFDFLPKKRQTLLFSATMPIQIKRLAEKILDNPALIKVESKNNVNQDIEQRYYIIEEHERDAAVIRLIDSQESTKGIIFCRTKREVDELTLKLSAQGYTAGCLHGDIEQRKRTEIMASFRAGKFNILVATDVAARGLDISDVTHVFNYHMPFDPESYVHRIGRTGRAGRKGIAITLVTPIEYRQIQRIQHIVGGQIQLCTIPTLGDLKKLQADKLLEAIRTQQLNENASKILSALEEEMDGTHLAYKLISILLARELVSGPDMIGLHGKDLQNIESRLHDSNRRSSNRRNSRGGGFGGNRSGSSGGRSFAKPRTDSGGGSKSSSGGGGRSFAKPKAADGATSGNRSDHFNSRPRTKPTGSKKPSK
jgi:ATP-dependent RNA helicase DeaD